MSAHSLARYLPNFWCHREGSEDTLRSRMFVAARVARRSLPPVRALARAPLPLHALARAKSTSSRSAFRSPHEVLGIGRESTPEQVKAAYREQALRHHPDRNPEARETAEQRFKEVSHAFEQLSAGAQAPGRRRGPPTAEESERLFWDLFGVGRGRAAARQPIGNIPARLMNWQQYAALLDSRGEAPERLRSGLEARGLYRDTLRELRGIDEETAASVRETARTQIMAHSAATDVEVLRNLVVDGRHSLEQLRISLGVAIIRPAAEVERIDREQAALLQPEHCAGKSIEAEAAWARFVTTRLVPTLGALDAASAPRRGRGRAVLAAGR